MQFLRGVAYTAHLGELIAELRQDKGLTQKELGDILCVSSGTISNYKHLTLLRCIAFRIMELNIEQFEAPNQLNAKTP